MEDIKLRRISDREYIRTNKEFGKDILIIVKSHDRIREMINLLQVKYINRITAWRVDSVTIDDSFKIWVKAESDLLVGGFHRGRLFKEVYIGMEEFYEKYMV